MELDDTRFHPVTKVTLERLKIGLLQYLSPAMIEDVDIMTHINFIGDEIALRLKAFVWAEEESARHQEVVYPADWWQAFKVRFFPPWAIKRWPINYKRVILDVKAVYPEFRPAVPNQKYVLHIIRSERDETE